MRIVLINIWKQCGLKEDMTKNEKGTVGIPAYQIGDGWNPASENSYETFNDRRRSPWDRIRIEESGGLAQREKHVS
ncbi:unnamed protein product [Arctia plantaginis]|uniref:Uncharacterized protein n=1 Tax=Arctia plantaginis TaxID=874455 RepID=A0A8S0YST1_ARCPL|nr:unnamed protein product [Arctia plantaginis]